MALLISALWDRIESCCHKSNGVSELWPSGRTLKFKSKVYNQKYCHQKFKKLLTFAAQTARIHCIMSTGIWFSA
jgi:hypothetical protein